MAKPLSENALFFREYIRHFHHTGAVLPSGRFLAAALTRFVNARDNARPTGTAHTRQPRKILEVGPGTGAVTRRIVGGMSGEDTLDLVELNDSFVEQLERRFREEPAFRTVAGRAKIHHCPIEEMQGGEKFDLIVSGLPLNNFAAESVAQILATLIDCLEEEGTLSFFEYIAVRSARAMVSGRAERTRLRGVGRAMKTALKNHEIRREAVWLNVPPAWVHHLQK